MTQVALVDAASFLPSKKKTINDKNCELGQTAHLRL